jgi:hypothetical protein
LAWQHGCSAASSGHGCASRHHQAAIARPCSGDEGTSGDSNGGGTNNQQSTKSTETTTITATMMMMKTKGTVVAVEVQ